MIEWTKALVPLLVLIVGFLGGAVLSKKQIDQLQLNALDSAQELGGLDEKISALEKESEERFKEIGEASNKQAKIQEEISLEIERQLQALKKHADELVFAQEEIEKLTTSLTGEEGEEAKERIIVLNELLGSQENAQMLISLNESVANLSTNINAYVPVNYLNAEQQNKLEEGNGYKYNVGGESVENLRGILPEEATGAVLKVIVNSNSSKDTSGSFLCSDKNGDFSRKYHYYQNGITVYGSTWSGGTMLCPFFTDMKIKWRTASNEFLDRGDSKIKVIFSVVGWY